MAAPTKSAEEVLDVVMTNVSLIMGRLACITEVAARGAEDGSRDDLLDEWRWLLQRVVGFVDEEFSGDPVAWRRLLKDLRADRTCDVESEAEVLRTGALDDFLFVEQKARRA